MAVLRGFIGQVVVGKESTYGTAPTAGQTTPVLSEALATHKGRIEMPLIRGGLLQPPLEEGLKAVSGTLKGRLGYEGYEALLVAALGTVSTTDNGDGTYTHDITPAETLSKSLSVWADRGPRVFLFKGIKINGITLSAEAAADQGIVEWELDTVGQDYDTDTSLPTTVNADEGPPYVALPDVVIRLGDQTDALASGDTFYPARFELKVENNLAGEHYVAGQDTILEPVRNDFLKYTLTLGFARFEDTSTNPVDSIRTWAESNPALQADLTFTYDSSHVLTISLANLRIQDFPDPTLAGPDVQAVEITLAGAIDDAVYDNANMADDLKFSLKNTNSTAW